MNTMCIFASGGATQLTTDCDPAIHIHIFIQFCIYMCVCIWVDPGLKTLLCFRRCCPTRS